MHNCTFSVAYIYNGNIVVVVLVVPIDNAVWRVLVRDDTQDG